MTKQNKTNDEPDWLDPANDRKTPYTEAELDLLADGFIAGNETAWGNLVSELGEKEARAIVKNGFRKMDEINLANMEASNTFIN